MKWFVKVKFLKVFMIAVGFCYEYKLELKKVSVKAEVNSFDY